MNLTFWGAAQTVMGSMHQLTVENRQYLPDCGIYQGHRTEGRDRNSHLPFSAARVTAVYRKHSEALDNETALFIDAVMLCHHLKNNIGDPRNLILITGFQAGNTLGRKIVDSLPEVPIFGDMYPLRAEVVKLKELSGHVTRELKKVFLVHGELPAQKALADAIQNQYGLNVEIPARGHSYELD